MKFVYVLPPALRAIYMWAAPAPVCLTGCLPEVRAVEIAEREANLDEMIEEAIANTTVKTIDP